ncbi:hypothetical protein K492DRAFT_211387 [Lichtheimia hyalospora FSU 10163]|nr:hypothetical protein K492DRAFT_211387 [Lichtheimia hyalospora FSU 10163]
MDIGLSQVEHWIYGAEGNATIVLRYVGDNSHFIGYILRLKKQSTLSKDQGPPPQFSLDFSNQVITPLIGPEYMVPLSIVGVSQEFLEAISIKIEIHRPERRRSRQLDPTQQWGFLAPDLTYQYPWAIELKPKWGFKPASSKIHPEHRHIKKRTCRFCMHSCLKHSRTDLEYCPMDLYSRDPIRVQRALKALRREKHLHKNYQTHGRYQHELQDESIAPWMEDFLQQVLCRDPILTRLYRLQRQLDRMDIEHIWSIYTSVCNGQPLPGVHDINTWKQVVERFKARSASSSDTHHEDDYQQHLFEFVLSMIFKDCSIFISIAEVQNDNVCNVHPKLRHPQSIRLSNGNTYRYNISLVDVDLKMMAKIPYWYELDQRIVSHTISMDYAKHCEEVIWENEDE